MFISPALAEEVATTATQTSPLGVILEIVLMVLIFYLLLLRPQQKRIKEHETKVNALQRGDEIVTGGGIIGKVVKVMDAEDELEVEIANGVTVRIARYTVRDVITSKETPNSKKVKSKK